VTHHRPDHLLFALSFLLTYLPSSYFPSVIG
jgi:hypothetical protein